VLANLALAYWARAVGPQAADASQADSVRDGVLFVRTRSSVWSHELTLHKPRLIQALNRMLGGRVIRDIVFRAQGLRKTEIPTPEVDTPGAEELAAVLLDPDEKAELRIALRKLFTISDDRIRQAIGARMTSEAKLRHWRLERGWKLCIRCSLTHKTEYDLCPNCRLNG
jgi:predicted nucleic acid-binding Zn ribbon protein